MSQPIFELVESLFPITRSITGDGVRKTLDIIKEIIPELNIIEVPTGETVFDWTIPPEWNINDAYVKNLNGERVIDFQKNNLHVLGYSKPIGKQIISFQELKKKIHTLPEFPDRIPYLKSYYERDWGFCMTHNDFKNLHDDEYLISIDSSLEEGHLTYGEYYLEGKTKKEFLLTCYTCHPSMANDSISGVALLTFLAKALSEMDTYYSYRFLFIPETIGSITWLARNKEKLDNIKFGLVATCLGDTGPFTYKESRNHDAEINKIASYVLKNYTDNHIIEEYFPFGSDERQFCSPGINLPVGSLMRTRYHKFDQYHTSADDLTFVSNKELNKSYNIYLKIIEACENNFVWRNTNPNCEPNLGKRGLFKKARVYSNFQEIEKAYFWILGFSDGNHSLLDIAIKSNLPFETLMTAVENLKAVDLIQK